MHQKKRNALREVLQRIKNNLIEETPTESCEICRKTDCSEDEWITCEDRIAHANCLKEYKARKASRNQDQPIV